VRHPLRARQEIDSFDRLILQGKDYYEPQGYEIHYETTVSAVDPAARHVEVPGQAPCTSTGSCSPPASRYQRPEIPGAELDGLTTSGTSARPSAGTGSSTRCSARSSPRRSHRRGDGDRAGHRGIETHLVDPHPWAMAEIADPDIMAPVEESWRELGVHVHLNTRIDAFLGTERVHAVKTSGGEIPWTWS
jgi:NADH oxidase (H2O2-forming)